MMPPITFVDEFITKFLDELVTKADAPINTNAAADAPIKANAAAADAPIKTNAVADAPIKPSELHPFLNADVVEHFGRRSHLERGRQFEKPFMYAVYARYLLEYWKDTSNPWVSLAKVFEGAVKAEQVSVAQRFEVNLSAGFKRDVGQRYEDAVENAATYMGGSAHHDAYIWCREKTFTGIIVPDKFPIPLQLRHGKSKETKDLEIQLLRQKPTIEKVLTRKRTVLKQGASKTKARIKKSAKSTINNRVPLLLSVNESARDVLKDMRTTS